MHVPNDCLNCGLRIDSSKCCSVLWPSGNCSIKESRTESGGIDREEVRVREEKEKCREGLKDKQDTKTHTQIHTDVQQIYREKERKRIQE